MKLIDSKAELLTQEDGLQGIYKQIELAGRTCYKSEDKITDSSSVDFVKRMTQSGHTAMLEHGTVYLNIGNSLYDAEFEHDAYKWNLFIQKYRENPYSKLAHNTHIDGASITTNLRVLQENGWLDDLKYLCEPTEFHERRISLKFTTSIGITRELIRHRVFSFANESTRYCNYSKDKFNNELTFIIPSWLSVNAGNVHLIQEMWHIDNTLVEDKPGYIWFMESCAFAQKHYINMLKEGLQPQQAREALPLCTKSDIVMTGFVSDWKHFFDLRLLGTTGKPHPDMLLLAEKAKKVLEENDLWNLIYNQND